MNFSARSRACPTFLSDRCSNGHFPPTRTLIGMVVNFVRSLGTRKSDKNTYNCARYVQW